LEELVASKVGDFAWQLLHNRIPTRSNLFKRPIIEAGEDRSCALCGEPEKSSMHLSIYCEVAKKVWKDINFAFPHDVFSLLNDLMEAGGRKLRKGLILIWNSVIWTLEE
jgi:hypothetical protein